MDLRDERKNHMLHTTPFPASNEIRVNTTTANDQVLSSVTALAGVALWSLGSDLARMPNRKPTTLQGIIGRSDRWST